MEGACGGGYCWVGWRDVLMSFREVLRKCYKIEEISSRFSAFSRCFGSPPRSFFESVRAAMQFNPSLHPLHLVVLRSHVHRAR
jgi:hypothetical protein